MPMLRDRRQLDGLLTRLDERQAWSRLVEPLLASELDWLASAPEFPELNGQAVAELQIKANRKSTLDRTIRYEGDVRVRLAGIEASCKEMSLLQADNPAAVIVTGADAVHLTGLVDYPAGIDADRFAYHADTGVITLGGNIRLHAPDKTHKLRACILTQTGQVRDARSLLDDFRTAITIDAKLALLPKITQVYGDAELPDEVRYLLALHLLRPHMGWHAPYLPPLPDHGRERFDDVAKLQASFGPRAWQQALGGETWMLGDIPASAEQAFAKSLQRWYQQFNSDPRNQHRQPPDIPVPTKSLYFWRLRDPGHADIARALRLLDGIRADDIAAKARRWVAEIGRNNTVVTFDSAGAAYRGRAHSLLMDVRNAETVAFKLYRVRDPRELLYATKKIGADFVYRAHYLTHPTPWNRLAGCPEG
ncbi:MAG TPA: hypothetical protein VFE62_27850 [Gemmataceae bacterium]|nr:hypothetical protein [Gemmataceae bacterium]